MCCLKANVGCSKDWNIVCMALLAGVGYSLAFGIMPIHNVPLCVELKILRHFLYLSRRQYQKDIFFYAAVIKKPSK